MGALGTGTRRGAWGAALALLAACGLDESGLIGDGGSDVLVFEGGADVAQDVAPDVPLPPTCATTDVSCFGLDGGLPDGWMPYVFARDGGACPAGDFQRAPYVANTRMAGGCACGSCTGVGTWSCAQPLAVATGLTGCGGLVDTADSGACRIAAAVDDKTIQLVEAGGPAVGSSIGCEAGAPTPAMTASDPVAICGAGCDAGASAICGQADTTSRCIVATGIQTCPGTLTQTIIGAGADPSCAACTCAPSAPPTCTASAKIFDDNSVTDLTCNGAPSQTLALDGSCQGTSFAIQSYIAAWNDPGVPSCTPGGGGGDAGLAGPLTVCCTN
ncbi:MAG TPA: hypothetical protein VGH28_34250 [Polyangiaceae bacterium]|jgi:hypothetical protein